METRVPAQSRYDLDEKIVALLRSVASICDDIASIAAPDDTHDTTRAAERHDLIAQLSTKFSDVEVAFRPFGRMDPEFVSADDTESPDKARQSKRVAIRLVYSLANYLSVLRPWCAEPNELGDTEWPLDRKLANNGTFPISHRPFTAKDCRRIRETVGREAASVLLPYAAEELRQATQSLFDQISAQRPITGDPLSRIESSTRQVVGRRAALGLTAPDKIECYPLERAAKEVQHLPGDFRNMTLNRLEQDRRILSVPDWSGTRMYPAFQFDGPVFEYTSQLLPDIPAASKGENSWAVALFFWRMIAFPMWRQQRVLPIEDIREVLSRANQFAPDRVQMDVEPVDQARLDDAVKTAESEPLPQELFRVAERGKDLFTHESATPGCVGRFNLSGGNGTCYFASSGLASWIEAMDWKLTVSLADVIDLDFCTVGIPGAKRKMMKVSSLTSASAKLYCLKWTRRMTQRWADALVNAYTDRIGAKYCPPSTDAADGFGFAIWGPKGRRSPEKLSASHAVKKALTPDDSRGKWTVEHKVPALEDGSGLAQFIKKRVDVGLPVALWVFPPEFQVQAIEDRDTKRDKSSATDSDSVPPETGRNSDVPFQ